MNSFFKKLFGIKETDSQQSEILDSIPPISVKVEFITQEIVIPENTIVKSYDIAEIKKQTTRIKDKEGFLASVNFTKEFIKENNIDFKELISLFKKVIPYMLKEKTITGSDIITYINTEIDRFPEKDSIENYTIIADILSRISNLYGLEYLETKLGGAETDKNKDLSYFDALILLSDYYLTAKKTDIVFQTIRRASMLVRNFKDKYDYILKQKIVASKSANFCLNGYNVPKYADYLHYEIVTFILEICGDIIMFPQLWSLFGRKKICFNEGWWFKENEDFDNALEDLKMTKFKNELVKDIYEFTFNELPLMIGIPKEYFNEKVLEPLDKLNEDFDKYYPKWKKIMDVQEIFNSRPFNEIAIINNFASTVVKKYYDMENTDTEKRNNGI